MFRSVCPFCHFRQSLGIPIPSWQIRGQATLQKRRPARTQLSATVADARRTPRRIKPSPFGNLNLNVAPKNLNDGRNSMPSAERKRQSRSKDAPPETKRRDPMKALKMQRALSNVPYDKRSRIKNTLLESAGSFAEFKLLSIIQESISTQALGGMVDVTPTPIQKLAIPALLARRRKKEMDTFLLAAETGSGKTLAYLLPVLDAIKRAEAAEIRSQPPPQPKPQRDVFSIEPSAPQVDPSTARPKAIILVPTAELVTQVGSLVKSLGHTIKLRSALLSSSYTGKVIRSRLFSTAGIDIVITTPHLLSSITESDPNVLARVTHLVVDEADSLFDRSFKEITSAIIDRSSPSLERLILCSATIPRNLDGYLRKRFPDMNRLTTPNLHAIPRRVQLSVVEVDRPPYHGKRDLAAAQILLDISKEGAEEGEAREKKVVVFVNSRDTVDPLTTYLVSKGIKAIGLTRDTEARSEDVLASFTSPTSASVDDGPSVLVTTDIASRGIDTLPVKHVLLYDVPHTSIDFIHRLGRVGRMNRRGRGVVLVSKNDRRDVVKEIREGMFRGQALI